jgi:hypothetical protein
VQDGKTARRGVEKSRSRGSETARRPDGQELVGERWHVADVAVVRMLKPRYDTMTRPKGKALSQRRYDNRRHEPS